MKQPLPVTDADLRAAWNDHFEWEVAGQKVTPPPFDGDALFPGVVLNGLRRVLERDRARVLERSND